jgi:hypothetical protein
VRRHGGIGRAIWTLRYESLSLGEMDRLAGWTWREMVRRARKRGALVPGLT